MFEPSSTPVGGGYQINIKKPPHPKEYKGLAVFSFQERERFRSVRAD